MAQPITIPNNSMIVPVNLSSSFKTITLPVVSSNPGRFLILKDVYGNSGNSTLRLSTVGLDRIERSNVSSMTLSNPYGAWWFTNDGSTNWFLLDAYLNSFYIQTNFLFQFTSFSVGSFNINGNTTFVNDEARITSNGNSLAGALYYPQKVNIQNFTTNFVMRFELTNADGGFFLIQNSSSNALGGSGGDMGFVGITPSLGIRFDTWNGSLGQFSTDVLSNGSLPSGQGASGVLNTSLGLTPNTTWNFRVNVSYNGTTLSYTIINTSNGSNFSSNVAINIPTIVGANTAWVGFVGATGGATELQYVSYWDFAN